MKRYRWLPLLLALGIWIATPGCAGPISSGRGDYRQNGQNIQRRAFDQGHRKGFDRGRDDARHGRRVSYERYREYRDGNGGNGEHGRDRDAYREAFRQGFRAGYAEAFNERRPGRR